MRKKVYVGIDLGGTSVQIGITSIDGKVIGEIERPTPQESYQEVFQIFKQLLEDLLFENELSMQDVVGIGVGVPALLNMKNGSAYEVFNLGWRDVPFKDELERIFQLPCFIDNDANVAAFGEHWNGAGRGSDDLMCITIGTGIGCGLILNGEIYHGTIGIAGEIGHVIVRPSEGRRCKCGKLGCFETEASATAIVAYALDALQQGEASILQHIYKMSGAVTAKDVIDAARDHDDPVSVEIVNRMTFYLGWVLSQLSNVLNPEKIIIGGGVSRAGSFILDPIRAQFQRYALNKVAETVDILPATLGNSAGWLGAARLVHRKLEQDGG